MSVNMVSMLPIPDWGLRCPHCQTPVAGLYDYRCDVCLRPFELVPLLAAYHPIIILGLVCPKCGYSLTGLTVNRCPECGSDFDLQRLFEDLHSTETHGRVQMLGPSDHHLQRREPQLTGRERPLPDLLLYCRACTRPLAGAEAGVCPFCGAPFKIGDYVPEGEVVDMSPFVPPYLGSRACWILYENKIPYVTLSEQIWGGLIRLRARVPRAFFFDALHALANAMPAVRARTGDWQCPTCREMLPASFDLCWRCNTERSDKLGPQAADAGEASFGRLD
jgi:hypothetical protein